VLERQIEHSPTPPGWPLPEEAFGAVSRVHVPSRNSGQGPGHCRQGDRRKQLFTCRSAPPCVPWHRPYSLSFQ